MTAAAQRRSVIPANAGIQARRPTLDSGFRRNDGVTAAAQRRSVIPANAGIQTWRPTLDSGLRRNDGE